MTALTREDLARFQMGSLDNPMEITAVIRVDGDLGRRELLGRVEERLLRIHRLRARVVPTRSGARWVEDPHFDLAAHVHALGCPLPRDERALGELVSDLASQRLDPRAPLWSLHVVEGAPGGTAIVARFHHVVADGLALLQLLYTLGDDRSASFRPPPPKASVAEERRSEVAGALRLARLVTSWPDPPSPMRAPPVPRKRVGWSAPLPLADVRARARAHGVRTHEVVLSMVAGAVRRAMGPVSPSLVVRAMVPISLRRSDDRGLGNHFASVFLPIPIGVEDPGERLRIVSGATADARAHLGKGTGVRLLGLVGGVGAELERAALRWLSARASLVVSNLPGPRQTLHLLGHRVTSLVGLAPVTASLSLGVTVLGHGGSLCAGIAVGNPRGLDPWAIADALPLELGAL